MCSHDIALAVQNISSVLDQRIRGHKLPIANAPGVQALPFDQVDRHFGLDQVKSDSPRHGVS